MRVLWAGAAVGVAAVSYSCRQVIGIEDSPPEKLISAACGLPYGTTECASCVDTNCCSESSACASDPSCSQYFQCLGGCAVGDWKCRAQCRYDNAYSAAAGMPSLYSCTVRNCEKACGLECGAAEYTLPPPDAAASCQSCLVNNDCNSARACTSAVDCLSWAQCYNGCSTPDCQQACAAADDAGAALAAAIDPKSLCSPACAVGTNWACVGHVVWPAPTTYATTLTASVIDFVSPSTPVSGATAQVCPFQSCDTQLGQGVTDGKGNLTIQVPAVAPHVIGLGADSYVVLTSPTLATTLFFWEYPVSQPQATIGAPELYVAQTSEWAGAFALQGVTWDSSSRGLIGVLVRDCRLSFASGVKLSISGAGADDPMIRQFYLVRQTDLDFSAAATDATTGVGGFVNVPAGEWTVMAQPNALDASVSSAKIYVRVGALTEVFLNPMPTMP